MTRRDASKSWSAAGSGWARTACGDKSVGNSARRMDPLRYPFHLQRRVPKRSITALRRCSLRCSHLHPHPCSHSHDHSGVDSHSPSPASKANGDSHGSHGHGHSAAGSMNMCALVLHVLGDALGNVGVIATGLIIMLAPASWNGREVYFDPAISLVIACIILGSAVLLVRSASFVLLQGVPATISIEQVRAAILVVEGVLGLHELHIWQLSESKNIASVYVLAARERDFMPIAAKIRKALHDQGIHSCTIQPEYYGARVAMEVNAANADTVCLVLCPPEECNPQDNACCPPPPVDV
ncbi:cation efflux family-domain-containing protein [Mycena leptocephala]|nr:cation efflux family-domain-containing protein [Mycena leptocephala]